MFINSILRWSGQNATFLGMVFRTTTPRAVQLAGPSATRAQTRGAQLAGEPQSLNSNFSMFTMTIWLCEDLFNEFLKFPLFFELWLNYTNCHLSIKIKTNCKNIASKFSNDYFLGGSFKILPSKPFTKPDSRCKLGKP